MAKATGHMKASGKLGDKVYVKTKTGTYIRSAPREGSKKDEPALKKQYSGTIFFNGVASQIRKALITHVKNFVDSKLYHRLLKIIRCVEEHQQKRWLLIRELVDMEVTPAYPFTRFDRIHWRVEPRKGELLVHLDVTQHPDKNVSVHEADSYYYELLVLVWNKSAEPPVVIINETDWIAIDGGLPAFDIPLRMPPGARHWLLFMHGRLAIKGQCLDIRAAEGMRCVEAGSYDKKEITLAQERMDGARMRGSGVRGTGAERTVKKEGVKAKSIR
jgi:hypothetical protein